MKAAVKTAETAKPETARGLIPRVDTLVLSGGSSKCIASLGKLQQLQDSEAINLKHVKFYYATSAGALIAAFLAIGFSIKRVLRIFETTNVQRNKVVDAVRDVCILPKSIVMSEMSKYFSGSFKELKALYDVELNVYCYNLSTDRVLVCNHVNTPDLAIPAAVSMSMALPPLLPPYSFRGEVIVDGGFINNFPIMDAVNHRKDARRVLGILTVTEQGGTKTLHINKMNFIFFAFSQTVERLQKLQLSLIPAHVKKRMIILNIVNGSTFAFNLDSHVVRELFYKGYYST